MSGIYTSSTSTNYGVQFGTSLNLILLQCGDNEVNPGPATDTQLILDAINDSGKKMTTEINAVKTEMHCVKSELKQLKSEVGGIKSKLSSIESHQVSLEKRVIEIEKAMEKLDYNNDVLVNDMESLSVQRDCEHERITALEDKICQLESNKLKCSLRVFGLPENESNSKSIQTIIDENIFSVVRNNKLDIRTIPIVSAMRVGNVEGRKPRMVIMKFERFNDKLKLFKYRGILRDKSIRISNDLSYTQRQMIKNANQQGQRAYFKNGRLCKVSKSSKSYADVTKRGVRTLDDRNREQLRQRSSAECSSNAADNINCPNNAEMVY